MNSNHFVCNVRDEYCVRNRTIQVSSKTALHNQVKIRQIRRVGKPRKKKSVSTAIANHSFAYIISVISEVLRTTSLDALDVLITLTISTANVALPPVRRRGRTTKPDPVTGISRSAIRRILNVPLETVRRRVGLLLESGVIEEHAEGLFVADASPLGAVDNHAELVALNAQKVRQLILNLKSLGVGSR